MSEGISNLKNLTIVGAHDETVNGSDKLRHC